MWRRWGAAPAEGTPEQGGRGVRSPQGSVCVCVCGAAVAAWTSAVRTGMRMRRESLGVCVWGGSRLWVGHPLGPSWGPPFSVKVGGCNINPCREQGGFGWPNPCFNVTFWHCCSLYLLPPLLFLILQVRGEKCQAGSRAPYRRARSPACFPQAVLPTDFSLHNPLLVLGLCRDYQLKSQLSDVSGSFCGVDGCL